MVQRVTADLDVFGSPGSQGHHGSRIRSPDTQCLRFLVTKTINPKGLKYQNMGCLWVSISGIVIMSLGRYVVIWVVGPLR